MNLWLRLLWLLLSAPFRDRLPMPDSTSVLTLRVLPNDLDASLHMNNGRYLSVMDLGRLDMLIRSGLGGAVWRNRWTPIVNAAFIRFRRELRVFQRYRLETRAVGWDSQTVLIEQSIVFANAERSGQTAARALFKVALYDRKAQRYVPVQDLMAAIGVSGTIPPMSAELEAFLAADRAMRDADRSKPS